MTIRAIALAGLLVGWTLTSPAAAAPAAFGPADISYIASAMGFEPLTRPVRTGRYFALRAIDPYDVPVRLVIDGHTGRRVSARPVDAAYRAYPPGGYGYGHGYGDPLYGPPGYGRPMVPEARPHQPPRRTPMPRPRPDATAKSKPAPAPSEAKPAPAAEPQASPEAKPEAPPETKPN